MLRELSIKNFAIIDDLRIRFQDGITVLSGETGAGKSIIIQAVNLLLGSRADAELVRTGAEAAELEAVFDIATDGPVGRLMAAQDLDPSEGLLIRRVISAAGRNRIYINDRTATIKLLADLTATLASISGQHAHQRLLDETQHLLILDQFGGLMPLRIAVSERFRRLQPMLRDLEKLKALRDRQAEQRELLAFQRDEIQDAGIHPGEDAELEQELLKLKNAEMLYQVAHDGLETVYAAEDAVIGRLVETAKTLEKAGRIDPALEKTGADITDAALRLEAVAETLRTYLDTVSMDPARLSAADDRLNFLKTLKRKYGGSLDAVLARLAVIETELADVENLSDRIEAAEAALAEHHRDLCRKASELSQKRAEAAAVLARKVEQELGGLGMAGTRFEAALTPVPASDAAPVWLQHEGRLIFEDGFDRAAFMIAPNVGEALKPLAAIASGGELSRVVLALKAILADTDAVGTIIFDEVDAGIGGGVAEVVGRKIAGLAAFHQVVCITHLAQIAKFADHHYRISKQVEDGRTHTRIQPLAPEDRITEIARMVGGVEVTPATLAYAREMLGAGKN